MAITVERKHLICPHIARGELARHSTIKWATEPEESNTTDYHWDLTMELCPFCSGVGYGKMHDLIEGRVKPRGA